MKTITPILTIIFLSLVCCSEKLRKVGNEKGQHGEIFDLHIDTLVTCDPATSYKIEIEKRPMKHSLINGEKDNKFLLNISTNNEMIFSKLFSKNDFRSKDNDSLSNLVLFNLVFDGIICTTKEMKFFFGIGAPESDWMFPHEVYIDSEGNSKVFEIDEAGTEHYRPDLDFESTKTK